MDNNKIQTKKIIITFWIVLTALWLHANNVQITNVRFKPNTNTIKFDISWDNSWRSSILNNWDAAYVFIKYYDPASSTWLSANFTDQNNVIPAGFSVSEAPGVGRFIFRAESGSGISQLVNVELGIESRIAQGIFDVKLFALEMVYIPVIDFMLWESLST